MNLSIIVAVSTNHVIGASNQLIWRISSDLKRFKELTMGHHIIMGRKTWETIGRALPGRTSVVITHNTDYKAEGATVVGSLNAALELAKTDDNPFVIGGGQIYNEAISKATKLYVTHVHAAPEGDTFFPEIKTDEWNVVVDLDFPQSEKNEHPFTFTNYERI